MKFKYVFSMLFAFSTVFSIIAQEKTNGEKQDEELGKVSWYRSYDQAIKVSQELDKDILILFQEVPGCSTCRNYGHNVLSHPLMVEAIDNLFVPLVIHNNKGGEDRKILEKFNEPTWNNPVVRIINSEGNNITDRLAGDYSALGLINAMKTALSHSERKVPDYLDLLQQELLTGDKVEEKTYEMYCFWTGEKHLGSMEGVISTEAGFVGSREVVKVKFDEEKLSEEELTQFAKKASCEPISSDKNFRVSKSDLKYNLKHTIYKYLPLTISQSTKINSAIATDIDPKIYLSPKQGHYLQLVSKSKKDKEILFNLPFEEAWEKMNAML